MRNQLSKLQRGHSTKSERIFAEVLKENHISFRAKARIGIHEVDFLIGHLAVEINGHAQDEERNNDLIRLGYTPIHISNEDLKQNRKRLLNKLYDY